MVMQSPEDGALPLLQCIAGSGVQSGELYVPGDRGPVSFICKDGITGWPQRRALEDVCKDVGRSICCGRSLSVLLARSL
eukprot:jgi/Ulvmu1/11400/UM075_0062.1